jgi:MFS transporter, ACS family, hexuronate transporter
MPVLNPDVRMPSRPTYWIWGICGLLLLATTINYMDRLTLNQLAPTIKTQLGFGKLEYGHLEFGFGIAFALGSIVFGILVDRWNVFWVYPLAVLAWSAAGFCSGLAGGFWMLLLSRVALGFCEAANWPCGLRATQHLLPPEDRSMGNSLLQSGTAVGAVLIQFVLLGLFDENRPETWRTSFFVVGTIGTLWVVVWWSSLRPRDLAHAERPIVEEKKAVGPALPRALMIRRFTALIILVITINMAWHFPRAWLSTYLQESLGYSQRQVNWFSIGYYISADVGALSAGILTLRLARSGMSVHRSRSLVFLAFALLCLLFAAVPFLPPGPTLMVVLMVIAFASLGVFPMYYSFTQDLSTRHQGKITGTLGFSCWVAMAIGQELIGHVVEYTGSYTSCFLVAALLPMTGYLALLLLWGSVEVTQSTTEPAASDELVPVGPVVQSAQVG